MMQPRITNEYFADLFSRNLIPLRVVVGAIAVGFYDYLLTFDDEIKYVWTQKRSLGRLLFFWIRYYTLVLLLFDLLQIHTFAIRGVANAHTCVLIDPITRLAGAISLWSVQIYMQLRIFALYNRSKKVALFNGVVFIFSIGFFLWIMALNAMHRGQMIAHALNLPLPGCPTINGGFQWALWIPPSIFEFMLFLFALFKAVTSSSARLKVNDRPSLTATLLGNNMLYFLSVVVLLIFNNLMSVASTHIPWFGMAPFHAILGIVTGRIIIAFYKFTDETADAGLPGVSQPLSFVRSLPPKNRTSSTSLANSDVDSQQHTTDMDTYPNSESEDDTDDPTTPMLRSAPASDIEAGHRSRNGSWTSSAPSPIRASYSGARRGSLLQSCPTPGPSTRRQSIV